MVHLTGKNNEGPSELSGPVIIRKKLQGCKFLGHKKTLDFSRVFIKVGDFTPPTT